MALQRQKQKYQGGELVGSKTDLLPFTHTHTKTPKRHKWTVLKQAWQRDPGCLSFQPPLSRDTVTLVSHSYRYEFFHCYQPTTLLSQSWMNGTHGNRCNSLLRARYLAESHNVPVIEVELLKRPHTKSWKFSDKHEKRSCDEKHWAARGSSQAKTAALSIVVPQPPCLLHLPSLLCDNSLIQFINISYSTANGCHATSCHKPHLECKTLL